MLTPQDITDKIFVKALIGGYDMTGVDDFLETVTNDYTALYKENAILKGKLKVLVEKVEEYRSTEDAMRMALLTAQRMGEEITVEAGKMKDEILHNADMEVKAKIAETSKRVADEELRLSVAVKETAKFIELSQAIIRKHSEFLTKLETARRAVQPGSDHIPSSPPPPPAQPVQPEQAAVVADQIGSAVERLTADAPQPVVPVIESHPEPVPVTSLFNDDIEQARQQSAAGTEDTGSPKPKFDFDDLKFGANFDND